MSFPVNVEVFLERECPSCYGSGNGYKGVPCGTCDGTGLEVSDLGRELAVFLKRHYGLLPNATLPSPRFEEPFITNPLREYAERSS